MTIEGAKRFMTIYDIIYHVSDILGTLAFAASGAMIAIDRGMDLFGVLFLGCITAVGGGLTRDMLLGIVPPNAFTNPLYITLALITSAAVFLCAELFKNRYWQSLPWVERHINLLDALGLGLFSVIGVQTVAARGFLRNGFLCVFMGMMTGVGGGILRDVLSVTVPAVLCKQIYAVASLAGALACWLILRFTGNGSAALLVGMSVTITIRILATRFRWDLPRIKKES